MSIVIKCPRCRTKLMFHDNFEGTDGQCPNCKKGLLIKRRVRIEYALFALVIPVVLLGLLTPRILDLAGLLDREESPGRTVTSSDDHGDVILGATLVSLRVNEELTEDGEIEKKGDADLFRFEAKSLTSIHIKVTREAGSDFQPKLELLDDDGDVIETTRSTGNVARAETTVEVQDGDILFARVTGKNDTVGAYTLSVIAGDDIPDDRENARQVDLASRERIEIESRIETIDDLDLFELHIGMDGQLRVEHQKRGDGNLNCLVELYDDEMFYVTGDDDSGVGGDAILTWPVSEGEVLFVQAASSYGETKGDYTIQFEITEVNNTSSDVDSELDAAVFLQLDYESSVARDGNIVSTTDGQAYWFVANYSGPITAYVEGADGFDPEINVYDGQRFEIGSNDDANASGLDAAYTWEAIEGEQYFVRVVGHNFSVGPYSLRIGKYDPLDQDNLGPPKPIELSADGAGLWDGVYFADDTPHLYSFVAPLSGMMVINVSASASGDFDPVIYVYDETPRELAQNDDYFGKNSRVDISVREGATYFLKIDRYEFTTGDYTLEIRTEADVLPPSTASPDAGPDFESATYLSLDAEHSLMQVGTIDLGDVDVFAFLAVEDTTMVVTVAAGEFSSLDPMVRIHDEFETLVVEKDDIFFGFDSSAKVEFQVVAGYYYYVSIQSSPKMIADTEAGEYVLTAQRLEP